VPASQCVESTSQPARNQYSAVAILLHWCTAAALVLQIFLGRRLEDGDALVRHHLLQLHKSIGILILVLTLSRLLWRFRRPPPLQRDPPRPAEQILAHCVHFGFYIALLVLPLSGWAIVSMRSAGTIEIFGFVPWPHLPLVSSLAGSTQDELSDSLVSVHALTTWLIIGLLGLHVSGALKHHFISRDGTVGRMLPGVSPGAIGWHFLSIPVAGILLIETIYLIKPSVPAPRPKPASLEQVVLFLDVVGPTLERRCGACHSEDDASGGLSVANYDSLMQGGRSGPPVVPGQPLASELFRRISLPPEDPKSMPKNGRRHLTAPQIEAIRIWIEGGASEKKSVASMYLPEDKRSMLRRLVGEGEAPDEPGTSAEPLPVVAKANSQAVKLLAESGFVVRKVSQSSELLVVDFTGQGHIGADSWAALATIAAQIYSLNLYNSGVTDADLKVVGQFVNLTKLRLESDPVGDDGAAYLTSLRALVSLNLVNTKIDDLGITKLMALPKLRRLYVWRSSVSIARIASLKQERPDLEAIPGTAVAADNIDMDKRPAGTPN
jgi:cytochrome b561